MSKADVVKALENYSKAKAELEEHTLPALKLFENDVLTVQCPICGTVFQHYYSLRGSPVFISPPAFPIICCDKLIIF